MRTGVKMAENTISIEQVKSGDLLAWKRDSFSTVSDFLIHAIRFLTRQRYGHVGIAWRVFDGLDEELFVIEATVPKIRVARVPLNRDFVCIPMPVTWAGKGKNFLVEKIGKRYSFWDAVRSYLGLTLKKDDSFQCVELCHYFYEEYGIVLEHDFTPGGIVKAAEKFTKQRPKVVCK